MVAVLVICVGSRELDIVICVGRKQQIFWFIICKQVDQQISGALKETIKVVTPHLKMKKCENTKN